MIVYVFQEGEFTKLSGLITKKSYDNLRIWQWFTIIVWQTYN